MTLKDIINQSVYGTIGYISSQDDLNLLEQYILHNLPVLKEFKEIVVATNYKELDLYLINRHIDLWEKYFPNCFLIDSKVNRGHNFGTADLDNMVFDWCKENHKTWLCKSANDIILKEEVLDTPIGPSDFYYTDGIGYGGMEYFYQFDFDKIIENNFFPQTNFYFLNVSKTDYLNDKEHITEIYNKVQNIPNFKGNPEDQGFINCETQLKNCVERNGLSKYRLLSREKYLYLLQLIKDLHIHDPSHKNIMINGVCHFQFPNQHIIQI